MSSCLAWKWLSPLSTTLAVTHILCKQTCAHLDTCSEAHAFVYAHTNTPACMHTHTYMHTYMHAHTHIYIHTHTHAHARTHTCAHTNTQSTIIWPCMQANKTKKKQTKKRPWLISSCITVNKMTWVIQRISRFWLPHFSIDWMCFYLSLYFSNKQQSKAKGTCSKRNFTHRQDTHRRLVGKSCNHSL